MVGMLEIITYLLCVYLIFKGVEIFQIGLMGSAERRKVGTSIGVVMIIAGVGFAIGFAIWITLMAESIGNGMPKMPTMP